MRRCPIVLILVVLLSSRALAVDLYNGSLGTTPDAQGWLLFHTDGASTPVTSGGTTSFNTSAGNTEKGGFSNYTATLPPHLVNAGFPALNHVTGYNVTLDMQVLAESHTSSNRSGVGLIVLSSDLLGVELEFWNNEIWVQSGSDFQHAEGVAFNTTSANSYNLAVHGTTYDLFANGNPTAILSGNLRNYSAAGLVYILPNFMFLGDDTTEASGNFAFSRLAVNVPEPASIACSASVLCALGRRRAR